MEINNAVKTMSALAHEGRLTLMRILIQAGPKGMGAGELANTAVIGPTTASGQLTVLANAGLVRAERQGRRISYFANFDHFQALTDYLMHDCCAGVCGPKG